MKLSKKILLYMLVLMFILIMSFLESGDGQKVWTMLGLCILLIGGSSLIIRICTLERGIEQLPDVEAFKHALQSTKEKSFRLLVEGVERVNAVTKEHYSAKVMNRQSKIDSLQSQINPHFLYNTLECIRGEAILQKCDSIAGMAKSLASFFRYSISRKENIVPIPDELNNIKHYFLIQNYRFENKFRFEIISEEDEERYYTWLIPKMTIQPIVENAIFHGLETKTGNCGVKIYLNATEDKVILTVSDNGVGMNEETLERLRQRMEYGDADAETKSAHGNGIALYNVNQRIKLFFGSEYGLQVYSTEGVGTDVEIVIPIVTDAGPWNV